MTAYTASTHPLADIDGGYALCLSEEEGWFGFRLLSDDYGTSYTLLFGQFTAPWERGASIYNHTNWHTDKARAALPKLHVALADLIPFLWEQYPRVSIRLWSMGGFRSPLSQFFSGVFTFSGSAGANPATEYELDDEEWFGDEPGGDEGEGG
jgi:hypothetical protein